MLTTSVTMPIKSRSETIVMSVTRVIHVPNSFVSEDAADVAEYVQDLTKGLAQMTGRVGLVTLTRSLEDLAGSAGTMLAMLHTHKPADPVSSCGVEPDGQPQEETSLQRLHDAMRQGGPVR